MKDRESQFLLEVTMINLTDVIVLILFVRVDMRKFVKGRRRESRLILLNRGILMFPKILWKNQRRHSQN